MSEKQATIQQLAQLAMEGDNVNPIEWGELVFEQMDGMPEEQRAVVSMATMTKLLVENFVLNLRLEGKVE